MMPHRLLRMLFAAVLSAVFFVPLVPAAEASADAGKDRVAAAMPPAPVPAFATARCGRCGDGQCVKSCGETAQSCPVDCGGGGEPSAAGMATAQPTGCATPSEAAAKPNPDTGK